MQRTESLNKYTHKHVLNFNRNIWATGASIKIKRVFVDLRGFWHEDASDVEYVYLCSCTMACFTRIAFDSSDMIDLL